MRLITSEQGLSELSRDAGIIELRPKVAFVTDSEIEVVKALEEAKSAGLKVTARGSGTSIPSQAVGSGVVLLQDRHRVSFKQGYVDCEPALVKSELNFALDGNDRWMPVDPSSYKTCSVGGMVANNSSGSRTYKYGSTVDYVRALRVATPEEGLVSLQPMTIEKALDSGGSTGRVAKLLLENQKSILKEKRNVRKNSSGYRLECVIHNDTFDLPRLFVGSEGTLAVTTLVSFKTLSKPRSKALLVFETGLSQLDSLVERLRTHSPSAIELLDKAVFVQTGREDRIKSISRTEEPYVVFAEFDSESDATAELERVAGDSRVGDFEPIALTDPGDVASAWEVRNETLTVAADLRKGSRAPLPGVEDLVVPPERLGDLVKLLVDQFTGRGLEYISYGHAGDANLHMRPLLDKSSSSDMKVLEELMEECYEAVWKMGGSISGEHGDGMLRAPYVRRQYPSTYDLMREIKRIYDPKGLLNPGVKIV